MHYATQDNLRRIIETKARLNSRKATAKFLHISESQLSLIISGNRPISEEVAARCGYIKQAVFLQSGASIEDFIAELSTQVETTNEQSFVEQISIPMTQITIDTAHLTPQPEEDAET